MTTSLPTTSQLAIRYSPLTHPMRIEYHRTLLADRVRNAAFHAALQRVIVKGETTVADIGAGTGFLGFLAAKLGAKRVDLYETAEIAAVARKLLRHNRLSNCRIAEVHSTDVAEPDRVDVVVSRDARQLPVRGEHHRHAQRCARALPEAGRRHHSARGRAVRLPGDGRALLSRAGGLGRGRLRPRLRAGQGDERSTTSTCAGSSPAICSTAARRPSRGTSSPSTAATRRRAPARPAGRSSKRTTVYGLALWWSAELVAGVVAGDRPARSAHALGAALSAGPGADRASSRARRWPRACAPPPPSSAAPT